MGTLLNGRHGRERSASERSASCLIAVSKDKKSATLSQILRALPRGARSIRQNLKRLSREILFVFEDEDKFISRNRKAMSEVTSFGGLSRASLSRAGRGGCLGQDAFSLTNRKTPSLTLRGNIGEGVATPTSFGRTWPNRTQLAQSHCAINRHRNELSVPQHRPIQPRCRASIPRGPVSSVADRLAVSRERLPPEEGRSRCI
jgi:hypothetical protein